MYRNYPEVLGGNTRVRARSTRVIRCILCMNSFTNALAGCNRSTPTILQIASVVKLTQSRYIAFTANPEVFSNMQTDDTAYANVIHTALSAEP